MTLVPAVVGVALLRIDLFSPWTGSLHSRAHLLFVAAGLWSTFVKSCTCSAIIAT